jgi:hypothetical protein
MKTNFKNPYKWQDKFFNLSHQHMFTVLYYQNIVNLKDLSFDLLAICVISIFVYI